jgi:hypothetical protein
MIQRTGAEFKFTTPAYKRRGMLLDRRHGAGESPATRPTPMILYRAAQRIDTARGPACYRLVTTSTAAPDPMVGEDGAESSSPG